MSITTYTELQSAVASRLSRDDLTSIIPDFIAFAEKRINRFLTTENISGIESTSMITCVAGTESYALESDFLALKNIYVNSDPVRPLERLTSDTARKHYPNSSTGKPFAYTIAANKFYLFPTPDSDYSINYVYYAQPTALSSSNETNWITTNTPDLLLYGALVEAASHIKDDNALKKWGALFDRAKEDIQEADEMRQWSDSNMRIQLA